MIRKSFFLAASFLISNSAIALDIAIDTTRKTDPACIAKLLADQAEAKEELTRLERTGAKTAIYEENGIKNIVPKFALQKIADGSRESIEGYCTRSANDLPMAGIR